jgi:competence/damage-inducible protein CinA-like protein
MKPIAEIFSQGEEVINGQITDTNAAWLSQELVQIGFTISRHTAVGDKLQDLTALLQEISHRADVCICSGGLGPTIDDLTAEAVALAFDSPLQLNPVALAQIEQHFSSRNRIMADSNRKQALLPLNATYLKNACGSAPGFALLKNRCWFIFVPGVPSEMRHMFDALVRLELEKRFVLCPDKLITIKSIGIGESDLQQKLNTYSLPKNVQLGFRATLGEVQIKLLFPASMAGAEIEQCVNQVVNLIGDPVFAIDDNNTLSSSLVSTISQLMLERHYTLSILETASQGLIAAKCIGQEWLLSSNYMQMQHLLIDHLTISYSDDLAKAAQAIVKKLKKTQPSDLILLQLHQGSQQQLADSNTNTVLYTVLLTPSRIYQDIYTATGSIKRKQNQATMRALDLLRQFLQNKCHSYD